MSKKRKRVRYFATKAELARDLGVTVRTLDYWIANGHLSRCANGKWSSIRGEKARERVRAPRAERRKALEEKERAQVRKIKEETRLVKLRIMAARGEVVGRDEVEEAHQLFANVFRERMLTVPGRCRLKAANQPADAVEAIMDAEIRQALNEMPEELARAIPDKPPAALLAMAEQDGEE